MAEGGCLFLLCKRTHKGPAGLARPGGFRCLGGALQLRAGSPAAGLGAIWICLAIGAGGRATPRVPLSERSRRAGNSAISQAPPKVRIPAFKCAHARTHGWHIVWPWFSHHIQTTPSCRCTATAFTHLLGNGPQLYVYNGCGGAAQ